MKEDLSLLEQLHHGLCVAMEKGGAICFGKIHRKGYCRKHYERIRKYNSVNLPLKIVKLCIFIDCNQPHWGRGYCEKHYHSNVEKTIRANKGCNVTGCQKFKDDATTICPMHRARLAKFGSLEGSGKLPGEGTRFKVGHKVNIKPIRICIVSGCDRDSSRCEIIKGLCPKHYQRWNTHKNYNVVLKRGKKTHGSHTKHLGRETKEESKA